MASQGQSPVLHWHGDQFDIPDDAIQLPGTSVCKNQAFAVGPNVLGLQFHIEAGPRRIEAWLVGHACELAQAGIALDGLRREAER